MNKKTILIVEDEIKLARLLQEYLEQANHLTHCLHDGNQVIPWLAQHQADLIILDIMLPGIDGITLCNSIRDHSSVPIIIASAKITEEDRLKGLTTGADDYLCKPYSLREVVARVQALFRRCGTISPQSSHTLSQTVGPFSFDSNKMTVHLCNQSLSLTAVEFRLLSYLLHHPEIAFSRDELLNQMYDDYRLVTDRTIDTHIKNLRRKIEQVISTPEVIQSVYGVGYKLRIPQPLPIHT